MDSGDDVTGSETRTRIYVRGKLWSNGVVDYWIDGLMVRRESFRGILE